VGDEAITGKAYTKENQDQIQKGLGAFTLVLTVFAFISLVAGAFLIYNIFGIVVAQRTKELALLRAIGATRRQVTSSVMIEASATGLLASILGLLGGIGLAIGFTVVLKAVGLDVSSTSVVVKPRTIIISLVVGVFVTVVSALLPAIRASRVSPMAAIRDVAVDDSSKSLVRFVIGIVLLAIGLLSLIAGISSQQAASVGIGALFLFVAIVVLGPRLSPLLIKGIGGWLPSVSKVTGRLARDNALRNPRRTASTATSLILALTLISVITIFFSSFTASINAAVSKGFKGDFQLSAAGNGTGTLPLQLADKLDQLPQLQAVSGLSVGTAALLNKGDIVWGTDGPALKKTLDIGVNTGDLDRLVGRQTIALDSGLATLFDKPVGSSISLSFPSGAVHSFTVVATYTQGDLIGQGLDAKLLLPRNAFSAFEPAQVQTDLRILVKRAPGVSAAEARAAVTKASAAFPTAQIQSLKEIQKAQTKQIDSALAFVLVLLALSVFIGFLGIAITLALSVIERTRELGLLRAIGMRRFRMGAMVTWEAVLVALLGTLLGLLLGCVVGAALAGTFAKQIDTARISFPIHLLVIYAIAACVFGVIAAMYPAWRASRLNVLEAITTE
jgi:putative ABC transport system permease protein